jgi:Ribbon-helix-helix protein, copG family
VCRTARPSAPSHTPAGPLDAAAGRVAHFQPLEVAHLDVSTLRCYGITTMSKVRTTLTIDESVMKAVKMRAARTGRGDSQVIEESLRRDLGLDLLERLWEHGDLSERDATALAVEAQHQTRRRRR